MPENSAEDRVLTLPPRSVYGGELKVYATEDAIGMPVTSEDELVGLLESVPVEIGCVVVSALTRALWEMTSDADAQLELAGQLFGQTPIVDRLGRFLTQGQDRVLFSEQALARLHALLILHGSEDFDRPLTEREELALKRGVIAVAGQLEHHRELEDPTSSEEWLPYLTQNYAFNTHPDFGSALARNWRIFAGLARELPTDEFPVHCPLDEWLEGHTGLTIEEQLSLGFAMYAKLGAGVDKGNTDVVVPLETVDDLCRRLGFDERKRQAAIELISAPREWYADELRPSQSDPIKASWNVLPFLRRPFLRMTNGAFLLISPRAIETWLGDGLFYRLLDAAISRGQRALNDYTAYVGHLVERYAVELIEAAHPEPRLPTAGKVYREQIYGDGAKTSDLAIVYPHELVLIEVSSPRLTIGTRLEGRAKQVQTDLGRAVGDKLAQLGTVIEAIKPADGMAVEAELPGLDPAQLTTIRPIVVTVAPLHNSPPMDDYLASKAPAILGRNDVEPLEVLDLEDLEAFAGIAELGMPITNALERKQAALGSGDLPRWLRSDVRAPKTRRPRYTSAALLEVMEKTANLLGFGGPELDEHLQGLADSYLA